MIKEKNMLILEVKKPSLAFTHSPRIYALLL